MIIERKLQVDTRYLGYTHFCLPPSYLSEKALPPIGT